MKNNQVIFIAISFVLIIALTFALRQQFRPSIQYRVTQTNSTPTSTPSTTTSGTPNPNNGTLTPEESMRQAGLHPEAIGFTCDPHTHQCE